MKGYLAFPPSINSLTAQHPIVAVPESACTTRSGHRVDGGSLPEDGGESTRQATVEAERQKRREEEHLLAQQSEIEWVRAGGVLRDVFGRRDKARTEQIRLELRVQDAERKKMARWEAYEMRWRTMQSSTRPITLVEFPWPIMGLMSSRDLSTLRRDTVSGFLFESLAVRTNTTTKRERIRNSLLRWHPDKMALVLNRVVPEDLELVREGIHVVFGILKALQDTERTGQSLEKLYL